jgi:hypothetical protein
MAGRLSPEFDVLYADSRRPSIAPEYILRALSLQVFYSVRSERLLVEQIDYNLLFRRFPPWRRLSTLFLSAPSLRQPFHLRLWL